MKNDNSARILAASAIDPARLRQIVEAPFPAAGEYVLYWMQKAQRVAFNPALEVAAVLATSLRLPLVVLFVLTDYPGAAAPHYRFMLHGLAETAAELRRRGASFSIQRGNPPEVIARAARAAAAVIGDEPRLRIETAWRGELAKNLSGKGRDQAICICPLTLVETEAVVPPLLVSGKEEWSAGTLRRKLEKLMPRFLKPAADPDWVLPGSGQILPTDDSLFSSFDSPATPLYPGDRIPEQKIGFASGSNAAQERFEKFTQNGELSRYALLRNDPSLDAQSGLSPYLHFGQISPVALALKAIECQETGSETFVEQLVVRRELSANFVLYNQAYDTYLGAVPQWAQKTLAGASDRLDVYPRAQLEAAETDDPFWNAAQNEMVLTGKMHNYMRMYWGKRLLAWHADPAEAFDIALRLNDRYSLDGRDPNGYAGIAWCFGKHDRPWPSQPRFGAIRAMSPAGLGRKFDMDSYTSRISLLYIEGTKREE